MKRLLLTSIPLLLASALAFWFGYENQRYQRLMEEGRYEEAGASLVADPFTVRYNIAFAHAEAQNFPAALENYRRALRLTEDRDNLSNIQYNIGVILQQVEELKGAVIAYEEALRLDPQNREAKYNLERLLQFRKQQQEGEGGKKSLEQAPGTPKDGQDNSGGQGKGRGNPQEAI